jgi:hypothetical protein
VEVLWIVELTFPLGQDRTAEVEYPEIVAFWLNAGEMAETEDPVALWVATGVTIGSSETVALSVRMEARVEVENLTGPVAFWYTPDATVVLWNEYGTDLTLLKGPFVEAAPMFWVGTFEVGSAYLVLPGTWDPTTTVSVTVTLSAVTVTVEGCAYTVSVIV